MNFDNTVSLYHLVAPRDSFEHAVSSVFGLLKQAQERYPDWPRVFYVDIAGHTGFSRRLRGGLLRIPAGILVLNDRTFRYGLLIFHS